MPLYAASHFSAFAVNLHFLNLLRESLTEKHFEVVSRSLLILRVEEWDESRVAQMHDKL